MFLSSKLHAPAFSVCEAQSELLTRGIATLPPMKKAGLIVLFSGGIFVTMAGILRCVLIVTVSLTLGVVC